MAPWLLLPKPAIGVSPAPSQPYVPITRDVYDTVADLYPRYYHCMFVAIRIAFRTGPRMSDVNEGRETEKVSAKEPKEDEMVLMRGAVAWV